STDPSLGTVQVGSAILAPELGLTSNELGSSATVGGGAGVANGGNSNTDSIGTVQVGSLFAAPTLAASSNRVGSASVGGSSGIGSGSAGNSANRSTGTAQDRKSTRLNSSHVS